jgi:hypothetical protein
LYSKNRYFIYLVHTIHDTIREDMPQELSFILRFDEAKKAIQYIVDMPDKKIALMLTFLHQNKGVLPKRRRDDFAELTDEEIFRMQKAYREVYEFDLRKLLFKVMGVFSLHH